MKLDMQLAVAKGYCDKCHEEEWLFIPKSKKYGLLCSDCMQEAELEIDVATTDKQIKIK